MPRRLRLGALAALALIVPLSGCTPPAEPVDEAGVWAGDVQHVDDDRDDVIARAIIPADPDDPDDDPAAAEPLFEFPAPGAHVEHFEVRCHGGGTATFEFQVSAATSSHAGGGEVPCDEKPHEYSVTGERDGVVAVQVDVTADASTYAYAALIGTATASDAWLSHFEGRAELYAQAATLSWGSFGPDGDVSPVRGTDASAPGRYVVHIECAGAPSVTATVYAGADTAGTEPEVAHELACPAGADLEVETDITGLTVDLDSHGQPGAFLYAVNPEG